MRKNLSKTRIDEGFSDTVRGISNAVGGAFKGGASNVASFVKKDGEIALEIAKIVIRILEAIGELSSTVNRHKELRDRFGSEVSEVEDRANRFRRRFHEVNGGWPSP